METLEDFGISILSMLISIGDIPVLFVNYQWASVHSSQCLSIGNSVGQELKGHRKPETFSGS